MNRDYAPRPIGHNLGCKCPTCIQQRRLDARANIREGERRRWFAKEIAPLVNPTPALNPGSTLADSHRVEMTRRKVASARRGKKLILVAIPVAVFVTSLAFVLYQSF